MQILLSYVSALLQSLQYLPFALRTKPRSPLLSSPLLSSCPTSPLQSGPAHLSALTLVSPPWLRLGFLGVSQFHFLCLESFPPQPHKGSSKRDIPWPPVPPPCTRLILHHILPRHPVLILDDPLAACSGWTGSTVSTGSFSVLSIS